MVESKELKHLTNIKKTIKYCVIKFDNKNKCFLINGETVVGPKCNFIKAILHFAKQWRLKSWTFSGFNPHKQEGIDFRRWNYSKFDIVITNPDFSYLKDFVNILIDSKVNFIILSDQLSRGSTRVGLHIQNKECYFGFKMNQNLPLMDKNKSVAVDWITSYRDAQIARSKQPFKTGIDYNLYKDEYPIIDSIWMKDGTHPIWIKRITALPDNYYGWFYASVGALDYLDGRNFEWYGTAFIKWINCNKDLFPIDFSKHNNQKISTSDFKYDNKLLFAGILARRIK